MNRLATLIASGAVVAFAIGIVCVSGSLNAGGSQGEIVSVRSAYPVAVTIERLKSDIARKGIILFSTTDQSKLAEAAGVKLRPSTLLEFGNPTLGAQFITANPVAGLDWPVRLLVFEDEDGVVWAAYTDFAAIARRHAIADRQPQFETASSVVASITSTIVGE